VDLTNTAGAGKLIGPDGNEMDTESFLSDLTLSMGTICISTLR
jgi:hypothetical protein